MSCLHKSVVVVGSDETGASSARCFHCRAPLTRRIEGDTFVYVRLAADAAAFVRAEWRSGS